MTGDLPGIPFHTRFSNPGQILISILFLVRILSTPWTKILIRATDLFQFLVLRILLETPNAVDSAITPITQDRFDMRLVLICQTSNCGIIEAACMPRSAPESFESVSFSHRHISR